MKVCEKSRKAVQRSERVILQKARAILASMNKKEERILVKINERLKEHEEILERSLKVVENVDETLCNVLLAIRQNEYLQAYYPAQNGAKEQKVVGKYVPTKA